MNYINIHQLNSDIILGLHKIPNDIDLIVGIPRSGMIVASLIAVYMNKPLTDIEAFLDYKMYTSGNTKNNEKNVECFSRVKKALIVEDSCSSGRSIRSVKKLLAESHKEIEKIYYAAYVTNETLDDIDIYLKIVDLPRIFEWNYMHNDILSKACVDIDGVLCVDPTDSENDDGEKYIEFIKNAKTLFIPSKKIGWIITSRLEKYRTETEMWLNDNGIKYEHLLMLDNIDANKRKTENVHAYFKAKHYKKIKKATIFIESNPEQAEIIAAMTGKEVICVGDNSLYEAGIVIKLRRRIYIIFSRLAHKVLPDKIVECIRKNEDRKN